MPARSGPDAPTRFLQTQSAPRRESHNSLMAGPLAAHPSKLNGVLPDRETRARRSPGLHHLEVGSWPRSQRFQKIQNKGRSRVGWGESPGIGGLNHLHSSCARGQAHRACDVATPRLLTSRRALASKRLWRPGHRDVKAELCSLARLTLGGRAPSFRPLSHAKGRVKMTSVVPTAPRVCAGPPPRL